MLHALAVYSSSVRGSSPTVREGSASTATQFQSKAFDNLFTNRDRLNAYTRALLALAAHNFGYHDKAKTLIENLENGVKIDSKPDTSIVQSGGQSSDPSVIGTAHWGEDGVYWRWSEGGVEATSFALRALSGNRSAKQTNRARHQLAGQKPAWRAMEQHARHRHRGAHAQRLPAHEQRITTRAQLRVAGKRKLDRDQTDHRCGCARRSQQVCSSARVYSRRRQ